MLTIVDLSVWELESQVLCLTITYLIVNPFCYYYCSGYCHLKFHRQAAVAAAKANCALGFISKCFVHLDVDTLPLFSIQDSCTSSSGICKCYMGPYYVYRRPEVSQRELPNLYLF